MRMEHSTETDQVVLWTMGQAHVDDLIGRLRGPLRRDGDGRAATAPRCARRSSGAARCRAGTSSSRAATGSMPCARSRSSRCRAGRASSSSTRSSAAPCRASSSRRWRRAPGAQLEKGLLTGHPVVDVRVTLVDGKAHSVDSSDVAFQTAAALALKEAANESTMALLEPIDAVDITIADDYLGAVMSDLRGRRGQVLGTEPADGMGPDGRVDRRARRGAPGRSCRATPSTCARCRTAPGRSCASRCAHDLLPADKAKDLLGT